ncbi:MAG: RNA polymerase sigma factor [Anaerolineae bacterium]|nr:RNA polymerase sigma factor [Anaerolineae bacterium]
MLPDSDLMKQILEGDETAFGQLFDRYEEQIRRHVANIVHNDAAAQDVVQEAFLRVWTRAEQWRGIGTFKAWLYRIATNLALNHLRSIRRRKELPLPVPDSEQDDESLPPAWLIDDATPGPDVVLEWTEQQTTFRRLVGMLSKEKREVFRLVHEMEMSVRGAADELDIPEGTVKSRLYYAKKQLAREWRALRAARE